MKTKIDLVITRHRPLVELLRERGIIIDTTPVLEHASASDVTGKHVLGVLPHHLSSRCASITEVPMTLTQADREAMTRGDLSLDRTREIAGDPVTYYVSTERQWPVMRVFDRAVRAATPWSTFNVKSIGPGVLEVDAAEGYHAAQVDLYADRYRTFVAFSEWSPWLDENGEAHRDQSDVRPYPAITVEPERKEVETLAAFETWADTLEPEPTGLHRADLRWAWKAAARWARGRASEQELCDACGTTFSSSSCPTCEEARKTRIAADRAALVAKAIGGLLMDEARDLFEEALRQHAGRAVG